jgi:hypothetical protein
VTVTEVPATGLAPLLVTTYLAAGPATKPTDAEAASALPFSVPVIVAVPTVVEEVSVLVYVPFALSVTAESEPRLVARATTPSLVVRSLPIASFNWTVIVEVLVPSAVMDVGEAVSVDIAVEALPTVKATLPVFASALPFSAAETVAVPATVDDVSVAV